MKRLHKPEFSSSEFLLRLVPSETEYSVSISYCMNISLHKRFIMLRTPEAHLHRSKLKLNISFLPLLRTKISDKLGISDVAFGYTLCK